MPTALPCPPHMDTILLPSTERYPHHTTHSTVSEQWWDLGPLTDSEKVRLVQCRALFTPLSFPFIGEPKKTETMGKKMTH